MNVRIAAVALFSTFKLRTMLMTSIKVTIPKGMWTPYSIGVLCNKNPIKPTINPATVICFQVNFSLINAVPRATIAIASGIVPNNW